MNELFPLILLHQNGYKALAPSKYRDGSRPVPQDGPATEVVDANGEHQCPEGGPAALPEKASEFEAACRRLGAQMRGEPEKDAPKKPFGALAEDSTSRNDDEEWGKDVMAMRRKKWGR